MKKRERSVIQLLYYYFHIENLRNFSMFEFHNPIQTQPSYPIVPKNKFKTTIISINFKSAFRVTQHPLNCPERITKFTSRRVEAPLTAIQLSHPPPTHTHTVQNVMVESQDPESTQGLPAFYNVTRPSSLIAHRLRVE